MICLNNIKLFNFFLIYPSTLKKLINTTDEINKTCSVGETKENMLKNRCQEIIPYDRNRVSVRT